MLRIFITYSIALFCAGVSSYKFQIVHFRVFLASRAGTSPESHLLTFPFMPLASWIILLIIFIIFARQGKNRLMSEAALSLNAYLGIHIGFCSAFTGSLVLVMLPVLLIQYIGKWLN
jgi:hypothetical protein